MLRASVSPINGLPRTLILAILAICGMLWVAVSPRPVWAAFEEEDIPEGFQFPAPMGYGITRYQMAPIRKKPNALKNETPGTLMWGSSSRMAFLIFQSQQGQRPDSVILDLNKNQDLTDDPVLPFPTRGESVKADLQMPDGRKAAVRIQNDAPGILLYPARWHRGLVDVGGKKIMVALVDGDLNGLAPGVGRSASDWMIVDADGDGRLVFNQETGEIRDRMMPLQSRVLIENDIWNLVLDAQAPSLALERYEGPCGGLALDFQKFSFLADALVSLQLTNRSANETFPVTFSEAYTVPRLPAGAYHCSIRVRFIQENQVRGIIECSSNFPAGNILIEEGKTRTLTISRPQKIGLVVGQSERRLSIGKKMPAGPELEYSSFEWFGGGDDPMDSPSAPSVQIFAPGNPKPLAEGRMEYG